MLKVTRAARQKLTPKSVVAPFQYATRLSEVFHENTKLGPLSAVEYHRHIMTVLKSPMMLRLMSRPGKVYSLGNTFSLELPKPANDVERCIAFRRSERCFGDAPLTLDTLSHLLHFSYGVTDARRGFRAAPSGGGLYPLEVYIVCRKVDGLSEGIYHYAPEGHSLDVVSTGDTWDRAIGEVSHQTIEIERAAALMVISAVFERSTMKYLDRGYRLVLLEAGAVAQNLALVGSALGVGSCLLGGFNDDNLAHLLEANGIDEAPLVPIVLGTRRAERP